MVIDGQCFLDGFCDFEQDICGWINVLSGDDFDWFRDNGGMLLFIIGLSVDYIIGIKVGYYMYIEFFGGNRKVGEKVWLVSDIFISIMGNCFYFWYYMYGVGIGFLKIYKQDFFNKQKILVFSFSGN